MVAIGPRGFNWLYTGRVNSTFHYANERYPCLINSAANAGNIGDRLLEVRPHIMWGKRGTIICKWLSG